MYRRLARNGLLSCVCIFIVAAGLFFINNSGASADTVDYIVNVAPSLEVTLSSSSVVLDLNPNTKTSDSKDLDIKVSTNNLTGYKLTMSSTGDATDLVRDNTADGKNAVIPTLSAAAGSTAASLTDNTWGYKKDSGNFIPYVSGITLLESPEATNENTSTLSFASKINYSQAAGSYEIGLDFVAVANPVYPFMQNIDPSLCVTSSPTTVLDGRDLQEYLIQRLADGNCWMLDNLRLDLTSTKVQNNLTSQTTNASDELLGYLKNGGGTSPYPASGVSSDWVNSDHLPFIYTEFKDTIANRTYGVGSGKIGVIYNFCAASAGQYCVAGAGATGDITADVCPVGWRIPPSPASTNGSYMYLYNKYGNTTTFRNALSLNYAGVYTGDPAPYVARAMGTFYTTTYLIGNYGSKYTFRPFYIDDTYTMNNDMYREYGYLIRCILN